MEGNQKEPHVSDSSSGNHSSPVDVKDLLPMVESGTTQQTKDVSSISPYVAIYDKHSYLIVALHVILGILCSVFALPFVNLSQPDAGLRLRENPIADMGDGLLSAL